MRLFCHHFHVHSASTDCFVCCCGPLFQFIFSKTVFKCECFFVSNHRSCVLAFLPFLLVYNCCTSTAKHWKNVFNRPVAVLLLQKNHDKMHYTTMRYATFTPKTTRFVEFTRATIFCVHTKTVATHREGAGLISMACLHKYRNPFLHPPRKN